MTQETELKSVMTKEEVEKELRKIFNENKELLMNFDELYKAGLIGDVEHVDKLQEKIRKRLSTIKDSA